MAHHLAELLAKVEKCRNTSERRAAEERATSVILKIWEHRQQLRGTAYPLSQYRKAADVLAVIHPQPNQFRTRHHLSKAGSLDLTLEVFSAASSLALFALIDLLPERKASSDPAAVALLDAEEKEFLEAIEGIYKLFSSSSQGSERGKRSRTAVATDYGELRRARLELVNELAKDVDKLKETLTDQLPSDSVKPASVKRSETRK